MIDPVAYANQTERMYQASLPTDEDERRAESRETGKARKCISRGPHPFEPGCAVSYRAHTTTEDCTTCGDTKRVMRIRAGSNLAQDCPDCSVGAW